MSGFLDDLPDLGFDPERPQAPPRKRNKDFVPFVRVRCPSCGSTRCPVYNTNHIPIRYHRCQDCSRTFKSVEVNYKPEDEQ
jgi:ribosomal protein S27E